MLNIGVNLLLGLCKAEPACAQVVIGLLQPRAYELDTEKVLDAGLTGVSLARAGLGMSELLEARWDAAVLLKLGFSCFNKPSVF